MINEIDDSHRVDIELCAEIIDTEQYGDWLEKIGYSGGPDDLEQEILDKIESVDQAKIEKVFNKKLDSIKKQFWKDIDYMNSIENPTNAFENLTGNGHDWDAEEKYVKRIARQVKPKLVRLIENLKTLNSI